MRSHTLSLVRTSRSARPGMGGRHGAAPVASTACVNRTVSPSTSSLALPDEPTLAGPYGHPGRLQRLGGVDRGDLVDRSVHVRHDPREVDPHVVDVTPSRPALRAVAAAAAAASSALEGTHPVQRQSPPVRSRSTSITRAPRLDAVLAATMPAVPPPRTSRSHRAGSLTCVARRSGRRARRASGRPRPGRRAAGRTTATVPGAAAGAGSPPRCTVRRRPGAPPAASTSPGVSGAAGSASR